MAARSPARSTAGPEVVWRWAPSSWAMMPASVVLPRPGGPENSRWSGAWPRRRAASSTMPRWALSSAWPTKSARRRGRSVDSAATSSGPVPGSSSSSRVIGPRPGAGGPCAAAPTGRRRRPQPARRWPCGSPRPSSPARPAPPARPRPRCAAPAGAPTGAGTAPPSSMWSRDFSSTSSRVAVFLPTPGTRHSAPTSSSARTRTRAAGACTDRMARARAGPTPWAPSRASNVTRSSRDGKP